MKNATLSLYIKKLSYLKTGAPPPLPVIQEIMIGQESMIFIGRMQAEGFSIKIFCAQRHLTFFLLIVIMDKENGDHGLIIPRILVGGKQPQYPPYIRHCPPRPIPNLSCPPPFSPNLLTPHAFSPLIITYFTFLIHFIIWKKSVSPLTHYNYLLLF